MGLSIKNDELENRVRRLAEVSGKSMTGALRLAVDNELARQEAEAKARFDRAMEVVQKLRAELAAMPKLGDFTEHDLYDDYGLPK